MATYCDPAAGEPIATSARPSPLKSGTTPHAMLAPLSRPGSVSSQTALNAPCETTRQNRSPARKGTVGWARPCSPSSSATTWVQARSSQNLDRGGSRRCVPKQRLTASADAARKWRQRPNAVSRGGAQLPRPWRRRCLAARIDAADRLAIIRLAIVAATDCAESNENANRRPAQFPLPNNHHHHARSLPGPNAPHRSRVNSPWRRDRQARSCRLRDSRPQPGGVPEHGEPRSA